MGFGSTLIREMTAPLLSEPLTLLILIGFTLWASYFDVKTLTITNRFNNVFFLTGIALMVSHEVGKYLHVPAIIPSIEFGWSNIGGLVIGFLILFIPAFIKNHPMGGDIKMTAVLGFWIGITPMMGVLIVGVILNGIYWYGTFSIWKKYGSKTLMPFSPFFMLGVLVVYGIGYFV